MGGTAWSKQLSDHGPKFQVAVRACASGEFSFEIFSVSGEPRTLELESQHYASPADAARAGYEAMAAKGLQTAEIDDPAKSGRQPDPSPIGESGEVELGVLIPLVLVTNVVVAIVTWYAVGGFLR
jgi:hypothetical protein